MLIRDQQQSLKRVAFPRRHNDDNFLIRMPRIVRHGSRIFDSDEPRLLHHSWPRSVADFRLPLRVQTYCQLCAWSIINDRLRTRVSSLRRIAFAQLFHIITGTAAMCATSSNPYTQFFVGIDRTLQGALDRCSARSQGPAAKAARHCPTGIGSTQQLFKLPMLIITPIYKL